MNGKSKRISLWLIVMLLVFGFIVPSVTIVPVESQAATQQLNTKQKTLKVGKSYQLKVKNCKKKVTWKSSNKKVATVDSAGIVKAKKKGTVKITATVGNQQFACKIYIIGKNDYSRVITAKWVKKALGVPANATVKIEYGKKYYWDAGETYLVYVAITGTEKYKGYYAGSTFSTSSGDACSETFTWEYMGY